MRDVNVILLQVVGVLALPDHAKMPSHVWQDLIAVSVNQATWSCSKQQQVK
jgi:hypothetical protein